MLQCLRGIALITVLVLNCGTAFGQQDTRSGNFFMPHCRDFLENKPGSAMDLFYRGRCVGIIDEIGFLDLGICIPANAQTGQAIQVVLRHLADHPETLHKDFRELAREALQAAWPCKK